MSLTVTIEGGGTIELTKECVRKVTFTTDVPLDSEARTKDVGSTMTIVGRILSQEDDSTQLLNEWGLMAAEEADCYRSVVVEVKSGGITERKYTFPNAFVVNQMEDYGEGEGVGTFTLVVKQKKDKIADVTIEGGFV